jgi:hypothetical protein
MKEFFATRIRNGTGKHSATRIGIWWSQQRWNKFAADWFFSASRIAQCGGQN